MQHSRTYDVVVIGSGLGGLMCAVILAKEGMKVCVLEQDKQIGGCLQTFSLKKTVFDSCVHYIGGLGQGHTLQKIFSYAGIYEKLKLKAYDPSGFDRIAFGEEETVYPHAVGFDNFAGQLTSFFPEERESLKEYIRQVRNVGDHFPLYRLRSGSNDEKGAVSGWGVGEVLERITKNPRLRSVLAGNNLLYAGQESKTPFYLHALVSESYMHSAHKVVPGSSEIAKHLAAELRQHGADIYRNTKASRLFEQGGRIEYAETEDGQRYHGKQFISGVHPQVLLGMLQTSMIRPAYRNRVAGLEQTISAFMVNLVLKPMTISHRPYNLYWNADEDSVWKAVKYEAGRWPLNYALYFAESRKDVGYAESLSILTYMHYDEVKEWEQTVNRSGEERERGDDYEAFKEQKAELLLEQVYKRVPELRGNIIAQSVATPLTYRDYTGTPQGSLYGILKDVNNPNETTIAVRTRIPNLLLTGQNINLHGVLGVSITAIATCAELIGMEYLLAKINNKG